MGRVWRVTGALEQGTLEINEGIRSHEIAPFVGIKESGQGNERAKYGLDDDVEIKDMYMGGIDSSLRHWFSSAGRCNRQHPIETTRRKTGSGILATQVIR